MQSARFVKRSRVRGSWAKSKAPAARGSGLAHGAKGTKFGKKGIFKIITGETQRAKQERQWAVSSRQQMRSPTPSAPRKRGQATYPNLNNKQKKLNRRARIAREKTGRLLFPGALDRRAYLPSPRRRRISFEEKLPSFLRRERDRLITARNCRLVLRVIVSASAFRIGTTAATGLPPLTIKMGSF